MRKTVGLISGLLTLIGLGGILEDLSQWQGWAKVVLGERYGPISLSAGLTLLLVLFFWGWIARRVSREEGLPSVSVRSSHQSGGQTGVLNISVTSGQAPTMTTEEKAFRERLADELDGHGPTFFKRVNEWYTARVEEMNPAQAKQKDVEARRARMQTEKKMNELDQCLVEKVNRGAASYFKRNLPDEPITKPWLMRIKEGLAINSMWYRSKRLADIAGRVRNGEEAIKWPVT
jgi:hypothetical protein